MNVAAIKMLAREFPLAIRVYYEDTDAGGVVYYANYLKYFERGRTEYLRALGFEQDQLIADQDTIFAVRSIQVDYLQPAKFNDELKVITKISNMKKASINFKQKVISAAGDSLCTTVVQVACLAASTLKPRAIPEEIIKKVEALNGN